MIFFDGDEWLSGDKWRDGIGFDDWIESIPTKYQKGLYANEILLQDPKTLEIGGVGDGTKTREREREKREF